MQFPFVLSINMLNSIPKQWYISVEQLMRIGACSILTPQVIYALKSSTVTQKFVEELMAKFMCQRVESSLGLLHITTADQ